MSGSPSWSGFSCDGDETKLVLLASEQLPKLVAGLRALLEAHQPDPSGRCPTCRRGVLARRRAAPCRAYLAAHLCLTLASPAEERRKSRVARPDERLRHAG